jgi:hypothetical protein
MTRRVSTPGETRVRTGDCAAGFMTNANLGVLSDRTSLGYSEG